MSPTTFVPQTAKVALIGGGVIGAGWAARFALNGIPVTVYDPDPEAKRKVDEVLANAGRAYRKLTLAPLPAPAEVTVTADLEAAVRAADFIQESAPERLKLKQDLLARASRACQPDVIIGSSTSGLLPSKLQAKMTHPERFVVGHPFNPVYLIPLVEVCGGERTMPETIVRASAIYASFGMHPLHVRNEIDGFIADRLMEALWREALHLINDGIATTDEIDQAVAYGPGLRWAFMGTFLTYRLAGGEAGMRHFLAQFAPSLEWPWCHMTAPQLTPELIQKIASQSDAQAGDMPVREFERLRDDCLIAVLQGLKGQKYAAGAVLDTYDQKLFGTSHAKRMLASDDLSQPLRLHTSRVRPDWVDYNGHMTESRYLQVFGDSTDAVLRYVGSDTAYNEAGFSYYTVETHLRHLREVEAGVTLRVATRLLGADDKRMHLFHVMSRDDEGAELATAEHMMLHVDTSAGRACAAREDVLANVRRLAQAHAALPRPAAAGRAIRSPGV